MALIGYLNELEWHFIIEIFAGSNSKWRSSKGCLSSSPLSLRKRLILNISEDFALAEFLMDLEFDQCVGR